MITLVWDDGVRRRPSGDGEWRHYPCPNCADPSTHLGVFCSKNGNTRTKCLRCGAKPAVQVAGLPFKGAGSVVQATSPSKGSQVPLGEFVHLRALQSPHPVRAWVEGWALDRWPGLGSLDLDVGGLQTNWDGSLVLLPRVDLLGGSGGEVRRTTPGHRPFLLGEARQGPFTYPWLRQLRPDTDTLVVEGWADGAHLLSLGLNVLFLATTRVDERRLPPTQEYIFMLDGDDAGRMGTKRLCNRMLRRGQKCSYVLLKEGTDPAEYRASIIKHLVEERTQVRSLKDIQRIK